jgi:hypothetical protein
VPVALAAQILSEVGEHLLLGTAGARVGGAGFAFEAGDYLCDPDLIGRPDQLVAATGSAEAAEDPGATKGADDLLQTAHGDRPSSGNLPQLETCAAAFPIGQHHQRP